MTDDEFTYVMAYYGLNDGNRVDVDEIANAAGLSKSRIQSSVNFAMEKLYDGRLLFPRLFFSSKNAGSYTVTDLDRLYLDLCILARLQNHGIDTIADIIDFPKEKWNEVGLSKENKKVLERKLKSRGVDFSFPEDESK